MQYRRIGKAGIKVSVLSLGSWVTFGSQVDQGLAAECMQIAYESGVNFFDNAEVYGGGESETIMGKAFSSLGWPRRSYIVSSKFFWGIHQGVNLQNTLNRKYLLDALDHSLDRLGLDFLDLIYCHRPDPETPIEETVWTMHEIVTSHKALYWGTSEWSAAEISEAYEIADRLNLHKPIVEQPEYSLLTRHRVEQEYAPLYEKYGMGLTTWSPLASGILSGKYLDGVPKGSRALLPGYEWLASQLTDPVNNEKVRRLKSVADRMGCSLAQLSIAFCAANTNVSSVITGASTVAQVEENLGSLSILDGITPEIQAELIQIMA